MNENKAGCHMLNRFIKGFCTGQPHFIISFKSHCVSYIPYIRQHDHTVVLGNRIPLIKHFMPVLTYTAFPDMKMPQTWVQNV